MPVARKECGLILEPSPTLSALRLSIRFTSLACIGSLVSSRRRSEERALPVLADTRRLEILLDVLLHVVVRRHLVVP